MQKEVLIVDDEMGIRLLLQDILQTEGYRITAVTTGKEALEHIEAHSFSAVIIDYKLPIMSGVEVLQHVKHIDLPAIVITGMEEAVQTKLANKGLEAEVLAKPFDVDDISALVNNVVKEKEKC